MDRQRVVNKYARVAILDNKGEQIAQVYIPLPDNFASVNMAHPPKVEIAWAAEIPVDFPERFPHTPADYPYLPMAYKPQGGYLYDRPMQYPLDVAPVFHFLEFTQI